MAQKTVKPGPLGGAILSDADRRSVRACVFTAQLVMAFQDFTPPLENSPWVGLQNFREYEDVLVGGAQYVGNLSQ